MYKTKGDNHDWNKDCIKNLYCMEIIVLYSFLIQFIKKYIFC